MKALMLTLAFASAGCAMRFPNAAEQQAVITQMRRSSEAAIWNGAALCAVYPSCFAARYTASPYAIVVPYRGYNHQLTVYPSYGDVLTVWNHQTLAFETYTIY